MPKVTFGGRRGDRWSRDIEAVLPQFRGENQPDTADVLGAQTRDGQPLYKLARAGEVVEREPRSVTIARLELLGAEADSAPGGRLQQRHLYPHTG